MVEEWHEPRWLVSREALQCNWRYPQQIRLTLGTDVTPAELEGAVQDGPEWIEVVFPDHLDGRGFSLPAQLRMLGYRGNIVASGKLIPDQLTEALQVGFDAVLVDADQRRRHGEAAWRESTDPVVAVSYIESRWSAVEPIWQRR